MEMKVKLRKNSSHRAYCIQCEGQIDMGEICAYIKTHYFWRGAVTTKLHYQCISKFIEELTKLKEEGVTKYVFSKI